MGHVPHPGLLPPPMRGPLPLELGPVPQPIPLPCFWQAPRKTIPEPARPAFPPNRIDVEGRGECRRPNEPRQPRDPFPWLMGLLILAVSVLFYLAYSWASKPPLLEQIP